ncbi:TRAP transporter substrate-binding protein [Auritidibacter ignavus]|uniref:TRAP transporter substrate-binding protein n=1 Tax=Auritidibacter ignavus TaxID=678932 RepID=UPI000D732E60|nr:TRAP transporter substrate-binding protein DctP [Auritidibacter ignavus]PXA77615.1 hypothetical protein DCC26_08235 [Auritidibacter sp. NML120779]NIH72646.1 TRAP-type C4-dicarboxylate transport system substrate-binding protein [Auritidibacter ignavus]RMX22962.1 hypothetical protein DYI20_06945 [Auritidibacter ignavus]WGH81165.1 TRAP transporter substrate-binding protein DctP [Auritidibacter ignavus]WGH90375.1 TRAP transporter substrate-binding protein DctP [Auritidibacter ignavus]
MSWTTKTARRARTSTRGLLAVAGIVAGSLTLTACEEGVVDWERADQTDAEYIFTQANGASVGTQHELVAEAYMDAVEEASDGRIAFERTPFQAICDMADVADCIRDGRADFGLTVTDYTPHLLPTTSVLSISFKTDDIQAATQALYELHREYEPAKEVMEKANLEHVSTWPVGALLIGAKTPIDGFEDLDGLQARAAGPVTQRSLEDAGMNVSAITAGETYEALQRGVIDSVASSLDFGVNFAITEQLPYWVDPGFDQYTAYGMWWNKDSYESLPEDLQATVDDVTKEFNEGKTIDVANGELENICDEMLDSPDVEDFDTWSDEETQKWKDIAAEGAEETWLDVMDSLDFENAEEYLRVYNEKYESLKSPENPDDAGIACAQRWQERHGDAANK